MSAERQRRRVTVSGIVQGVGFRPFVYRLAARHQVCGFVQNTTDGVVLEAEGRSSAVAQLLHDLVHETPPLAVIASVVSRDLALLGSTSFEIVDSVRTAGRSWPPVDLAMCASCAHDLQDPGNRRFHHPFVTCTACGPRYTVVERLPYDRASTAMASFAMCPRCAAEYARSEERRFHAQTLSCHDCGPRLSFDDGAGSVATGEAALVGVQRVLHDGIVAVKGIGGFHLLCDAANDAAVAALRRRKNRPRKPLAILVANLERADMVVSLTAEGRDALESMARPIVLGDRRPGHDVAAAVAPGLCQIGVMLPQSPLHQLIADSWAASRTGRGCSAALVMTSGNLSEEPVVVHERDARQRLSGIADAWLIHDRPIVARADDSVVADVGAGSLIPIRRSRGLAPAPIPLPHVRAPMLAVGGELKSTFCLAVDGQAILSPHIGDMGNADTLDAFSSAVNHFCTLFEVEPSMYVCDLHPGYLSAHWAQQAGASLVTRVQHHHAHAASLMAEHGLGMDDEVVTICFDGTGYGEDEAIWGGEVLFAGYRSCRRLAHLAYAPLPGGDAAARHPARLALAYLRHAGVASDGLALCRAIDAQATRVLRQQLESRNGVVNTSSMGRLFDVISAIAGVCFEATYEGQAAAGLEALCGNSVEESRPYRFEWQARASTVEPLQIQWQALVRAAAEDSRLGVLPAVIASRFHDAVTDLIVRLADIFTSGRQRRQVGLTGGVFQNRHLVARAVTALAAHDIEVLTHRLVPPNDGGLSLGQAAIGAARLAREL